MRSVGWGRFDPPPTWTRRGVRWAPKYRGERIVVVWLEFDFRRSRQTVQTVPRLLRRSRVIQIDRTAGSKLKRGDLIADVQRAVALPPRHRHLRQALLDEVHMPRRALPSRAGFHSQRTPLFVDRRLTLRENGVKHCNLRRHVISDEARTALHEWDEHGRAVAGTAAGHPAVAVLVGRGAARGVHSGGARAEFRPPAWRRRLALCPLPHTHECKCPCETGHRRSAVQGAPVSGVCPQASQCRWGACRCALAPHRHLRPARAGRARPAAGAGRTHARAARSGPG